jgi:hypothetical protein
MHNAHIRIIGCASLVFIAAIPLEAQTRGPQISAAWGAMQYDALGTGTAPMMALRAGIPVAGSWLVAEGNLSVASLDEQSAEIGTRTGIAEGQLQFQLPFARVRPYVGVGGGWAHYFSNALHGSETSPTYSAATGLRFLLSPRIGASAELRLRGWNYYHDQSGSGFGSSAAEWTGGLSYTF